MTADSPRSRNAQKHQCRIVVFAALQFHEVFRRRKSGIGRFFDNDQRAGDKPAAVTRRLKCFFREVLAIWRVEEDERERFDRVRRTETRGIAPENAGDAAEAKTLDVAAQQRAGLYAFIDKERVSGAARNSFNA